jgi:hypothetical protein
VAGPNRWTKFSSVSHEHDGTPGAPRAG